MVAECLEMLDGMIEDKHTGLATVNADIVVYTWLPVIVCSIRSTPLMHTVVGRVSAHLGEITYCIRAPAVQVDSTGCLPNGVLTLWLRVLENQGHGFLYSYALQYPKPHQLHMHQGVT